eukprot:scaffold3061_cov162-Pinguiococcus_pyrenoidosus.AAC.1
MGTRTICPTRPITPAPSIGIMLWMVLAARWRNGGDTGGPSAAVEATRTQITFGFRHCAALEVATNQEDEAQHWELTVSNQNKEGHTSFALFDKNIHFDGNDKAKVWRLYGAEKGQLLAAPGTNRTAIPANAMTLHFAKDHWTALVPLEPEDRLAKKNESDSDEVAASGVCTIFVPYQFGDLQHFVSISVSGGKNPDEQTTRTDEEERHQSLLRQWRAARTKFQKTQTRSRSRW